MEPVVYDSPLTINNNVYTANWYIINLNDNIPFSVSWNTDQLIFNIWDYDYEYLQGVIESQSYNPSSEDFSSIMTNLLPYAEFMVIILFFWFVRKTINNLFNHY